MTIEERMDKIERVFGAQDEMVRELRKAVTATADMEARQSRAVRDHAEWLVAHDRGIQELREQGKEVDRRIADLASAIGEFHATGTGIAVPVGTHFGKPCSS